MDQGTTDDGVFGGGAGSNPDGGDAEETAIQRQARELATVTLARSVRGAMRIVVYATIIAIDYPLSFALSSPLVAVHTASGGLPCIILGPPRGVRPRD